MPLSPCKICRRHVRPSDGKCPFCGTLAAAALAIGLAFFSACGGKTTGAGPSEISNGSGAPLDAAPADAQVPRGDIYGVPQEFERDEPMYGVTRDEPRDQPRDQPIYGVPSDD